MVEPLVEARGAGRFYRRGRSEARALDTGTFCVLPGDRIAIVGPSGSGKSTLLHLMAGIDRPTSGSMTWPALGARKTLRPAKVALVPQAPSLIPSLNVVENVALPLLLSGTASGEVLAAMAALERFGLAALADKLPEELSGGQAQRVAMVRAIAGHPSLLLADEPTGQLDQATASQLLDALLEYLDDGSTALVIATHDVRVAARMDVVWHMFHGVLNASALAVAAS